jgi:glycogen synthase
MGGLGVMLTALSIAQSDSPYLSISVALPHYSYLSQHPQWREEIRPFANLSLPFTINPTTGKTSHIHVPISLLRWTYTPAPDFLNPPFPLDAHLSDSPPSRSIDVYLIGPSDIKPFSAAFRAKDEGDIYSAYKPLKQEWKDLYFADAAAELVSYLGAKDEATVFEDEEVFDLDEEEELEWIEEGQKTAKRRVDVVHLHGATNAMVAHFLRQREKEHQHDESPSRHPAIVYTLHDSLDEVEYSNLVQNVEHFLPPSFSSPPDSLSTSLSPLQPYIYRSGTQLFTSALGIDLADAVTFVSQSIAADIVSGLFHFHLQDLVMPSISKRAAEGAFIGVTNGLDFTDSSKNPFTAPSLVARGLAFPRVGEDVLGEETLRDAGGRIVSFAETKEKAKAHLVAQLPHFFTHPEDAHRPWILFIGRYQYNKGCQFFSTLLEALSSPSSPNQPQGRLVLLGARNNYPFSALEALSKRYPHHLTLIDDRATPTVQAQWGTLFRMASDFTVVPSLSEAFGLVAAEGLLFGSPVISTGVGGLREFLVPFPPEQHDEIATSSVPPTTGNAYLFDLFPSSSSTSSTQGAEEDYSRSAQDVRPSDAQLEPARRELRKQVERALQEWKKRKEGSEEEREEFTRRMVAAALELKWNREDGPVEEVRFGFFFLSHLSIRLS